MLTMMNHLPETRPCPAPGGSADRRAQGSPAPCRAAVTEPRAAQAPRGVIRIMCRCFKKTVNARAEAIPGFSVAAISGATVSGCGRPNHL